MKGIPTIVVYAGIEWPLARLAEALDMDLRYLGRWHREGKLTPAHVELYRHRKAMRELAKANGVTARQVSVRVARGMDRYEAVTRPLRPYKGIRNEQPKQGYKEAKEVSAELFTRRVLRARSSAETRGGRDRQRAACEDAQPREDAALAARSEHAPGSCRMSGGGDHYVSRDWDDSDSAVRDVSSVMPISVRNSQRIIVAREERASSKQAIAKHMAGCTDAHIAKRASDKRHMDEVNAFFADTSSAFAKIVPARPVVAEARRRAR